MSSAVGNHHADQKIPVQAVKLINICHKEVFQSETLIVFTYEKTAIKKKCKHPNLDTVLL